MKRVLITLLCIVLVFTCAACGNTALEDTSSSPSSTRSTASGSSSSSHTTTFAGDSTATTKRPDLIGNQTIAVPLAARQNGFTTLVFSDDFDVPGTIDYSGEGRPGYNWYIDRPYGWSTLSTDDFSIDNSVLTVGPKNPASSYSLSTFSKAGNTGFTWKFGYAEACIRFQVDNVPTSAQGRHACPAFWGISVHDVRGEKWTECGELDIIEVFQNKDAVNSVYYGGTLHDHLKVGSSKQIGTNLANAIGYKGVQYRPDDGWHTYAALWTEGYIAWYVDGVFMHSVAFAENELPVFRFRDYPDPLPSTETDRNWKGVHTIMNTEELVMVLGGDTLWPMDVDWVRIWS